jgi:Ca2+/Na+ antiporter
MSQTFPNGKPHQSLAEILQDAIRAANASWTETDKLYTSVCSALVALATIFDRSPGGSISSMTLVGILVLLLSINWMFLIKRYRRIVLTALQGLETEYHASPAGAYFEKEHRNYHCDLRDYLIAIIVFLMSLIMIFYSIART